jgi:molybdopterin/thiamine biosynthesis adenylyltransferase
VSATANHWYERDPKRLEWELDEFARHSLPAAVSYDKQKRLVIETEVRFRDAPVAIKVVYPHGYPDFAPTVSGAALILDRHQDPVGLTYCLLEDPSRDWHPGRSAGQLIGKNLRHLLKDTAAGQEAIRAGEAVMPEPESAFFLHDERAVVFVGARFLTNELAAASGTMTIRPSARKVRVLVEAGGLGRLDDELLARYPPTGGDRIGRWVSLWARPEAEDFPKKLLAAIAVAEPRIFDRLQRRLKRAKGLPEAGELVGLTFLEQGPTRDEQRRNWMFVEVVQKRGYQPNLRRAPYQAQALAPAERQRRLPELAGLADALAVVIGAGSLGAPVAVELAKAGVARIDILDCDDYDLNNTVRHVLPDDRAGEPKAEAVADYCRSLNPFIEVAGHDLCLGDSEEAAALLDELFTAASVVVDTTGAATVARYVARVARAAGVPFVVAGLTAASYGGDIFLLEPAGACLDCFLLAQGDGRLPQPPAGERSVETPIGCRHPAFAGAGFEATELAAITARMAIRASGRTNYAPSDSNWVVIDFRGQPHYQEGRLEPDADCSH